MNYNTTFQWQVAAHDLSVQTQRLADDLHEVLLSSTSTKELWETWEMLYHGAAHLRSAAALLHHHTDHLSDVAQVRAEREELLAAIADNGGPN